MAVTRMDGFPGLHHLGSSAHLISKQAPQLNPLLNNAVLNAAVFTPYPWLYRLPYPHAPPEHKYTQDLSNKQNQSNNISHAWSITSLTMTFL